MKGNLNKFLKTFFDYGRQPHVYLLIVYHLDNIDFKAMCYVSLTEDEAKKWSNEYPGKGLGRTYKKILLYKGDKKCQKKQKTLVDSV